MTTARSQRSRPRLATVLAVLCVLVLAAGIAMGVMLRSESEDNQQAAEDRTAVVQAAERFTETWNNFSADDVDGYIDRVSPLLTTKFRAEFTEGAGDVATGIQQQGLSSEGKVLVDGDGIPLVGIASIDGDSAQALVVADANRVASGQRVLRQWRWQLSLVKVDGEWLVDELNEV